MPSRTDDPTRTTPQIETVPDSRLATSSEAGPEPDTTDEHELTEETFRAIFSSNQRAGQWEVADEIRVHAIAGEVVLDFTRAELPPSGVVEIEAWAICGEVKIVVPAGAEIEIEGQPFMGSIEQQVQKKGVREGIREWVTGERHEDLPPSSPSSEPPYFRINGHAIMGAIKVETGR